MFLDLNNYTPPPDPPAEPDRPSLTPRQQKTLLIIVGFNIFLLFIAPIGGATVISALLEFFS
jgi:hypothetical protein